MRINIRKIQVRVKEEKRKLLIFRNHSIFTYMLWSNEGFVINVWFKLVNSIIHSKMKVVNNKNNFKMVTF